MIEKKTLQLKVVAHAKEIIILGWGMEGGTYV